MISKYYELLSQIGKGTYGLVHLARNKSNNLFYAIKCISKNLVKKKKMEQFIQSEISLLKQMPQNENIVKFYDLIDSTTHYYIVLEYCNGKNLLEYLDTYKSLNQKPLSENVVKYIIQEILKGLIFLCNNDIIHRDLKPENILINYNNIVDKENLDIIKSQIKISDFGFARKVNDIELSKTIVGTPLYLDPFLLKCIMNQKIEKGIIIDKKYDVWSIGIIAYQLLFGDVPFKGQDVDEIYDLIMGKNYNFLMEGNIYLSKKCIFFINKILSNCVKPSFEELLNDDWFNNKKDNEELFYIRDKNIEKNKEFLEYWIPIDDKLTKEKKMKINNFVNKIRKNKINKINNLNNKEYDTTIVEQNEDEIKNNIKHKLPFINILNPHKTFNKFECK